VSNPASLTQILHQVVSNKMVQSVLVSVARWKVFPKYKLRKRWTKKFMVSCSLATSLLSMHAAVCCAPSFLCDPYSAQELYQSCVCCRRMMRKTSAIWVTLSALTCQGMTSQYTFSSCASSHASNGFCMRLTLSLIANVVTDQSASGRRG